MRALLATDGTRGVNEAARAVLEVLHPDLTVDVVTIIPAQHDPNEFAGGFEGPLMTEEEAEAEHEAEEKRGRSALNSAADLVRSSGTLELVEGSNPGQAICEIAEERDVNLLIIGGSEKGWFRRLIEGSVTEYVVHHSPCPVLIMRHAED